MNIAASSSGFFTNMHRVLSRPRFASYQQTGGTQKTALCKYLWNTALCESLYPSFQMLEVGFRNAVHLEIAKHSKDQNWLTHSAFLLEDERREVDEAKRTLIQRKSTVTEPYLVAEMSFGFWTSLLDSRYDKVWHKIIADVFPNMPRTNRTRGDVSKLMNPVRKLRNAAMHHHSIWHWRDLKDQHGQIHLLIGHICVSLSQMAKQVDRFPQIYAQGPNQFATIVDGVSN